MNRISPACRVEEPLGDRGCLQHTYVLFPHGLDEQIAVPSGARCAGRALVAAGCSGADTGTASDDEEAGAAQAREVDELPAGYTDYQSEVYADDAHWLCKLGIADDVCGRDLDATVVLADGTTEVERHQVADDPPVDCFYVYPTTSFDQGLNSDFTPGEAEEISTVYNQVARLTSSCRVFAPIYRQATVAAIGGGSDRQDGPDPRTVAHGDVLDAFRYYIANESEGRGFVRSRSQTRRERPRSPRRGSAIPTWSRPSA